MAIAEVTSMAIRALVVDDSPLARTIIRHHLVNFGCEIVGEAENPAQALSLCSELKPDLITFDIMMPTIDGIDSLGAFRKIRSELPNAVLIVVSSLPFEGTRESFLREGALAYIVKPFNKLSFEPVKRKLLRVFPELFAAADS
jgi:two-component system chemotaxis response regulator CheY